jgi:hypothetical protein
MLWDTLADPTSSPTVRVRTLSVLASGQADESALAAAIGDLLTLRLSANALIRLEKLVRDLGPDHSVLAVEVCRALLAHPKVTDYHRDYASGHLQLHEQPPPPPLPEPGALPPVPALAERISQARIVVDSPHTSTAVDLLTALSKVPGATASERAMISTLTGRLSRTHPAADNLLRHLRAEVSTRPAPTATKPDGRSSTEPPENDGATQPRRRGRRGGRKTRRALERTPTPPQPADRDTAPAPGDSGPSGLGSPGR